MTAKPKHYDAYNKESTELAEKTLLEVWASLGEFRKDMVLVGGLAPRYIYPATPEDTVPHCGTMDVDLGLSLADQHKKALGFLHQNFQNGFFSGAFLFTVIVIQSGEIFWGVIFKTRLLPFCTVVNMEFVSSATVALPADFFRVN